MSRRALPSFNLDSLIGLSIEEANEIAENHGCWCREVARIVNGERTHKTTTEEILDDRINVCTENGCIVELVALPSTGVAVW
jgi:hypothetical protein